MKIKLSNRLQAIANLIYLGDKVADIGTDHGYLPIWLLQNNISSKVILSDINKAPLEKALSNIKKYDIEKKYELRRGNGLSVLKPQEADVIVIAGMGGILMEKLLKAGLDVALSAKYIILQPRRDSDIIRKYLTLSGKFRIFEESIVKEREKFCEIIVAAPFNTFVPESARKDLEKADKKAIESGIPEDFYWEFPKKYLLGNTVAMEFVKYRLKGALFIRDSILKQSKSSEALEKLATIEDRINNLKKFINCSLSDL